MSVVLCTVGAVTTVALVPRLVSGGDAVQAALPEASAHRMIADALVAIIAGSREVLKVGAPGADGRQELVLWIPASVSAAHIQPGEVLVLSFSPMLEVVTAHTVASGSGVIDPIAARDPGFASRFRALPMTQRHVVATGIRTMRTTVLSDNDAGSVTLRLELTFGPESADGEGAVSRTLPGIRMRP